jgi:hypothetical protein
MGERIVRYDKACCSPYPTNAGPQKTNRMVQRLTVIARLLASRDQNSQVCREQTDKTRQCNSRPIATHPNHLNQADSDRANMPDSAFTGTLKHGRGARDCDII